MPEISRFFGIVIKIFSTITTHRTFTQSMVVTLRSSTFALWRCFLDGFRLGSQVS